MASLQKMKKGRPYYYVREIARVEGKPKVVNQIYLGLPVRILKWRIQRTTRSSMFRLRIGGLWLANLIEQDVGFDAPMDSIVPRKKDEQGPTGGEYFLYALLNRLSDARSKRA